MSVRNDIRFGYKGHELRDACQAVVDNSTARLEHWKERYEAAVTELENTAVKVKVERHQVTGGEQAYVKTEVNLDAQRELTLAEQKIKYHQARIEEFDRWRRGFTHNADASFVLDPEDVAYFVL